MCVGAFLMTQHQVDAVCAIIDLMAYFYLRLGLHKVLYSALMFSCNLDANQDHARSLVVCFSYKFNFIQHRSGGRLMSLRKL